AAKGKSDIGQQDVNNGCMDEYATEPGVADITNPTEQTIHLLSSCPDDGTYKEYNACSSVLCNFLHSPVTSSLLAPNIFLRTLFSNTLNLCSSVKVRVQVSQP
ncbi:hypothetical protein ANN_21636, partial [Periplaneta americana]